MIRILLAVALAVLLAARRRGRARAGRGADPGGPRHADRAGDDEPDGVAGSAGTCCGAPRRVMICPRVFKAGFFFGGEGGACVLLARAGNGTWSYPAFYGMGSGSFGFQIGIQDSQLIMMIMTDEGAERACWTASSSSAPMPRSRSPPSAPACRAPPPRRWAPTSSRSRNARPVRRRVARGQPHVQPSDWNAPITASRMRRRQIVMRHAGGQSGRRPAARGADPLRLGRPDGATNGWRAGRPRLCPGLSTDQPAAGLSRPAGLLPAAAESGAWPGLRPVRRGTRWRGAHPAASTAAALTRPARGA